MSVKIPTILTGGSDTTGNETPDIMRSLPIMSFKEFEFKRYSDWLFWKDRHPMPRGVPQHSSVERARKTV